MVLRMAQISPDKFMHKFLPEKTIPEDLGVHVFNPACVETRCTMNWRVLWCW